MHVAKSEVDVTFVEKFVENQVAGQWRKLALRALVSYKLWPLVIRPGHLVKLYVATKLTDDLTFALGAQMKKVDENEHRRLLGMIIAQIDKIMDNLFTAEYAVSGLQEVDLLYSFEEFDKIMLKRPFDGNMEHAAPKIPYLMNSVWTLLQKARKAGETDKTEAHHLYEDLKKEIRGWLKRAEKERSRMLKEALKSSIELKKRYQTKKTAEAVKAVAA